MLLATRTLGRLNINRSSHIAAIQRVVLGTPFDTSIRIARRHYTPMTPKEEEEEKARVATLSDFAKDQELRALNRQIALLETRKGVLTGERYTWTGRYKALAREYGLPLVAWYWTVWTGTLVASYAALHLGGVDALYWIGQLDSMTGWDWSSRVDPSLGQVGLAVVVNEVLEPLRLPIVIVTVKPVMDRMFPPKY